MHTETHTHTHTHTHKHTHTQRVLLKYFCDIFASYTTSYFCIPSANTVFSGKYNISCSEDAVRVLRIERTSKQQQKDGKTLHKNEVFH